LPPPDHRRVKGERPQPHRTEQPGSQERVTGLGLHIRFGQTLRDRQCRIAYQAVAPEVGHVDFQEVALLLDGTGHLDTERQGPKRPQTLSVERKRRWGDLLF